MPRFRIFLSSPTIGFEDYREALKNAARNARESGKFDFFWFEEQEIETKGYADPCEAIFAVAGHDFDALFISFKDRVGLGTIAELDYFEKHIIPDKEQCKVWWSQVESGQPNSEELTSFLARLVDDHCLELPEGSDPRNRNPINLIGRLHNKLWQLSRKPPF